MLARMQKESKLLQVDLKDEEAWFTVQSEVDSPPRTEKVQSSLKDQHDAEQGKEPTGTNAEETVTWFSY